MKHLKEQDLLDKDFINIIDIIIENCMFTWNQAINVYNYIKQYCELEDDGNFAFTEYYSCNMSRFTKEELCIWINEDRKLTEQLSFEEVLKSLVWGGRKHYAFVDEDLIIVEI